MAENMTPEMQEEELARRVFEETMQEASYFISSKKDKAIRAAIATAIVGIGFAAGLMGSVVAGQDSALSPADVNSAAATAIETMSGDDGLQSAPLAPDAGPDWISAEMSRFVEDLNQQIQADNGGDAGPGRIFVLDATEGKAGLQDQARAALQASEAVSAGLASGAISQDRIDRSMDLLDIGQANMPGAATPDDGGYVCMAVGLTPGMAADQIVKDMAGGLTAGDETIELRHGMTSEQLQKWVLVHELGHCLSGNADYGLGELYNTNVAEQTADLFAALYHLQNGGSTDDVLKIADIRDMHIGLGDTDAEHAGVTHDTAEALRALVADWPTLQEDVKDASLWDLRWMAEDMNLTMQGGADILHEKAEIIKNIRAGIADGGVIQNDALKEGDDLRDGLINRFIDSYTRMAGEPDSTVSLLILENNTAIDGRVISLAGNLFRPVAGETTEGFQDQPDRDLRIRELMNEFHSGISSIPMSMGERTALDYYLVNMIRFGVSEPEQIADEVLSNKDFLNTLPGFSFMGVDSPAREQAVSLIRSEIMSVAGRFREEMALGNGSAPGKERAALPTDRQETASAEAAPRAPKGPADGVSVGQSMISQFSAEMAPGEALRAGINKPTLGAEPLAIPDSTPLPVGIGNPDGMDNPGAGDSSRAPVHGIRLNRESGFDPYQRIFHEPAFETGNPGGIFRGAIMKSELSRKISMQGQEVGTMEIENGVAWFTPAGGSSAEAVGAAPDILRPGGDDLAIGNEALYSMAPLPGGGFRVMTAPATDIEGFQNFGIETLLQSQPEWLAKIEDLLENKADAPGPSFG